MEDTKAFNVRLPKKFWKFLKEQSVAKEMSMNLIIQFCVEQYFKKIKKKG